MLGNFYALIQNSELSLIRWINSAPLSEQAFWRIFNISQENLLKVFPLILILCWYWSKKTPQQITNRLKIIEAVIFSFLATVIARISALALPFRDRPFTFEDLHFSALPYENLRTWSSFPSDHAVLGFALSASIFRISPIMGMLSSLHVLIVICLPRLYLGLHYPSDLIGGAILGIVLMIMLSRLKLGRTMSSYVLQKEQKYPQYFYVISMIILYEFVEMFEFSRSFVAKIFLALH